MLETLIQNIGWVLLGAALGVIGGAVGMFFYIQHKLKTDPNWVENLYQKQRALSMKGTEAIEKENAELKKQIEDFKAKETYEKLKADLIKELKG